MSGSISKDMPRKPKEIKKPAHRPLLAIDWNQVDDYLQTGCPGTKIADAIGVHHETLYNRCEQEKGMAFSAYSQLKRNKGDAILHKAQFSKALEGDTSLLIFLGKVRLEQRETMSVTVAPETEKNFITVMSQLEQMQKLRQNVASETAKAEEQNEL